MEWISFSDKMPEVNQRIMVYHTILMGGYEPGIYIAHYIHREFTGEPRIVIDDQCTNENNYRFMKYFSHWMPLPSKPVLIDDVANRKQGARLMNNKYIEKCEGVDMITGVRDCWNIMCNKDHTWRFYEIHNQPERLNPETSKEDVIV